MFSVQNSRTIPIKPVILRNNMLVNKFFTPEEFCNARGNFVFLIFLVYFFCK